MIDWDEVFEDVNWARGIMIILGGIFLIGAAVFMGLDWHRYTTAKTLLENDLADIQSFQKTWTAPKKDIAQLKRERRELAAELDGLAVELPESLDRRDVENRIRQAASSNGVGLTGYSDNEKIDGYALVLDVDISFSTDDPRRGANFMYDLGQIPLPHTVKSQPVSLLEETSKLTLSFYFFDKDGWEEEKSCEAMGITIPDPPERDISNVYVFNKYIYAGELQSMVSSVEQQRANLVDVKREFEENCELETEVDKLRNKIEIIKDKLIK